MDRLTPPSPRRPLALADRAAQTGRPGPGAPAVPGAPQVIAGALPEHINHAAGLASGEWRAAEHAHSQRGRLLPAAARAGRPPELAVGALPEHVRSLTGRTDRDRARG